MRPPTPAATIRVAQAFDTSQVPTTFTSSTRRNSAAGTPSNGPNPNPGPLPPATLATKVTVPSSSLARATARLHGVLVGDVGLDGQRPHAERRDLGRQRGQVVAAGGAVGRGVVVGPGDVQAGDVRAAPGQLERRGPPDPPRSGRSRHQRDPPFERARSGSVCETHPANVATNADGRAVRGVALPCVRR